MKDLCCSSMCSSGICGSQGLVITSVFDNWANRNDLKTAWGFAAIIEGITDNPILFDTGSEGLKLLANMELMGFDHEKIKHVIISHEHWDHTGGLDVLLSENRDMEIFIPSTFAPGMKRSLRSRAAKVVEVTKPVELLPGIFTTGVLGTDISEQSVIISTSRGGVLITGCAHPGIVNILRTARQLVPSLNMVIGGFHLGSASRDEILDIIEAFQDMSVQFVGPCHCSGELAQRLFREAYGDYYMDIRVGTRIEI